MTTSEICYKLGETKFKSMVLDLTPSTLKKIMSEVGIGAVRSIASLGTKKRSEDWAQRLWNSLPSKKTSSVLLYAWLGNCRNTLLTTFLDALEVKHQYGLTDEDFLNKVDESKLHEVANSLLENPAFEKRDVATYLLFLDASNQTEKFLSLQLEQYLS